MLRLLILHRIFITFSLTQFFALWHHMSNNVRSKYINADFIRMRDSGVSTRGIKSTITIIQEMRRAIIENGGEFNLFKYLFFKFLKVGELIKPYAMNRAMVREDMKKEGLSV